MTPKELAERIVKNLFTNRNGHTAERLVLVDRDGRDLGGWGEGPVRDLLAREIGANLPKLKANTGGAS